MFFCVMLVLGHDISHLILIINHLYGLKAYVLELSCVLCNRHVIFLLHDHFKTYDHTHIFNPYYVKTLNFFQLYYVYNKI